uniref:Fignl1 interacting regulator of recombination and mitosis n=1 Tax=Scleropages formosus TaxID=113540 RepID=A0A8C9TR90_SCLFO
MISILEALSGVVRHLCTYEEAPALDAIRSLPSCILTLLKDTFQHCKESESVYSGRLSLVADLLQALFKEAYSLQKGLMELLEKIDFESNISEEEVFDIVTVIHSLLEICTLISNLDVALHANTWKFIIKQSMKYQALLEGQLRHSDIVSLLCNDLLMSFRNCCELAEQMQHTGLQDMAQNSEYKLFQKTAKMCRFFANTLVHYIKEFKDFLAKSCSHFHHLYLQIFSKFPPSLWSSLVSTTHCNEMRSMVLVAMDPLITQLLPCRDFAEALTPDVLLPHCLLLTNIMGKLRSQPEEVLLLWCEGSQFPEEIPRLSIFQALLQSFRGCTVERAVPVLLPGLMMNGQAQSQVTLHHHVCVQLSACLATLPAPIFPQLVRDLLLADFSEFLYFFWPIYCCYTLLTVAHSFYRYGTAELCLHHVTLTAHLVSLCPLESYHLSHLGMLLRRMMFFMTPHHQVEFVETFSPQEAENLLVWSNVLRRALSEDVRKRVEQDIVNLASSMITNWLEKGCRLGELEKVVRIHEGSIVRQQCYSLCHRQGLKSLINCLKSVFLSFFKALACLSNLLSSKCPDVIMLSGLDFLASLGHLSIPPEMQSEVLPRLCSLFSAFLSEKTWILHQHALETFSLFAEVTSHEAVISQSLTSDEVKNEVVSFLSKTLNVQETDDVCIERLKLERSIYETHRERLETYKTFPLQPCSKRARQQTNEEQEFEKYLQAAESNLKALQTLSEQKPIPDWVTARLRELHPLITKINTALPPQT